MPWGLSSLGRYILVGCVAAWSHPLARSAWAGFAAQFVFAYASLAWTDDLFHELGRKAHWDLDWLTVNLLGVFVAAVLLQAIRYREAQSPRPAPQTARGPARLALPLAITIAALAIMAALDIDAQKRDSRPGGGIITAGATGRRAVPTALTRPAPGLAGSAAGCRSPSALSRARHVE